MPSKRHHAVPRFYLERFAKDDGLIWLHNVETVTAVRVNPKDAIVEKYLYSPEVGETPKDDSFEKFLAERIEGPAAPCLERLANGEEISSDERQRIALFIAYQEYRSQHMRDIVHDFATDIARDFIDVSLQNRDYMKSAFEKMGKPMSDDDLTKMTEAWNSGGVAVEATKIAWLKSSKISTDTAKMLYKIPWLIAEAPDGVEFLTSDTPVVKVLTDRRVPDRFAGGWLSPSAESTFALDPRTILIIRPDGKEGRIEASRPWCKDVNSRLIAQSRRFVVSRSRDDYVEKVAKKLTSRRSLDLTAQPDARGSMSSPSQKGAGPCMIRTKLYRRSGLRRIFGMPRRAHVLQRGTIERPFFLPRRRRQGVGARSWCSA